MPQYSTHSQAKLDTCHHALKVVFNRVIQAFDTTIICGYRGGAAQNRACDLGRSRVRFPFSKHNSSPSSAVDAGPYNTETRAVDWPDENVAKIVYASHPLARYFVKTLARWYYFGGFVLGVAFALGIKLRWGGDFNKNQKFDDNFVDMPHFELEEKV